MRCYTLLIPYCILFFLAGCSTAVQKQQAPFTFVIKGIVRHGGPLELMLSNNLYCPPVLDTLIKDHTTDSIFTLTGVANIEGFTGLSVSSTTLKMNAPINLYIDRQTDTIRVEVDFAHTPMGPVSRKMVHTSDTGLQHQLNILTALNDSTALASRQHSVHLKQRFEQAIEQHRDQDIQLLGDSLHQRNERFTKALMTTVRQYIEQHPLTEVSLYAAIDGHLYREDPAYCQQLITRLPAALKASPLAAKLGERIAGHLAKLSMEGKVLPTIHGQTPDGREISAYAEFKSARYTLVQFWASWCGPCIQKIPELNQLYQQHDRKTFAMISVSVDKEREAWLKAIGTNSYQGMHVAEINSQRNIDAYHITTVPHSLLVDNNGRVIRVNPSLDSLRSLLQ